jgi:hypothetical protein
MTDDSIERGAAEDGAETPVTPTEVDASRKPPSQPSDPRAREAVEDAGASAEKS